MQKSNMQLVFSLCFCLSFCFLFIFLFLPLPSFFGEEGIGYACMKASVSSRVIYFALVRL
jgi:hypothetical protein